MALRRQRSVTTILFTDIVGSTERAAELGDREWRKLQAEHHARVRKEIRRFGGRESNTAGDAFLSAFDRPASAIRCAHAIRESLREAGLEIRAGVHAGEIDGSGRDLGGLGVHIGQRVEAAAAPGEILVSGTVRELVVGAGFTFEDRGEHELKGVPGRWRLYAVTGLPPGPAFRTGRWVPEVSYRTAGLVAAGIVVLAAVALWLGLRGDGAGPAPDGISRTVIATMPFVVRGTEEVGYLGEGMVNLLGTKLDGAGDLRSVDSRALLARVSRTAPDGLDPSRAAEIARALGAGLYVQGEIVEAGSRLRIDAALYDTATRRSIAEASAEGTAEDVFVIVDEIAARILGGLDGAPGARVERVAAVTTASLPALKAYLNGEQAFRAGRYLEATEAFQQAVAEDTLFALAYYRLASAAEYATLRADVAADAAEKARRYSHRLSERDRLLLEASLALRRGDVNEADRLYRAFLGRWPDDVQAWFDLGETLFHLNYVRGRGPADAREPFSRVLDFDPDNTSAMIHLIRLDAAEGRLAAMDSLVSRYLALAGEGERALEVSPIQAFAHHDVAAEADVLRRLDSAPDVTLEVTMYSVASFGGDLESAERVARVLTGTRRSPEIRGMGHLWAGYARLASGRWKAGLAEIDRARGLSAPAYFTYYRVLARLLPWAPTTDAEIEQLLAEARTLPTASRTADIDPTVDHQGVESHVRESLIGMLEARLGRGGADRAASRLEAMGGTPEASTLGIDLARSVEGYAAWRRGDARDALERFEAMPMQAGYASLFISDLYSHGLARYLRARMLQELGRDKEAEGWYGGLNTNPYELVFRGPIHLRLAEIREQAGDREGAIAHYRAFVDLWKGADPELQPMVSEARAALARLGA